MTLRHEIVELLNDINNLISGPATDNEAKALRAQREVLMAQLFIIIRDEINKTTQKYAAAVKSLNKAADQAKKARTDLEKISRTISKIASAINKVEKIVNMGIRVVS